MMAIFDAEGTAKPVEGLRGEDRPVERSTHEVKKLAFVVDLPGGLAGLIEKRHENSSHSGAIYVLARHAVGFRFPPMSVREVCVQQVAEIHAGLSAGNGLIRMRRGHVDIVHRPRHVCDTRATRDE